MIEQGIEQWKRRFHVLHSEVRVAPNKVCRVIYACAILHNFCKDRGIPLPDADDEGGAEEVEDEEAAPYQAAAGPVARGVQAQRDHFAYLHFK